jgi:hypothetical protein
MHYYLHSRVNEEFMSTFIDKFPLLVFSSAEDKTNAQRIARLAKA